MKNQYLERVINLMDPKKNIIFNMTYEEAVEILKSGDVEAIRKIDGQFSLVAVNAKTVRMARSIGRPLRYFIAKQEAGPILVISERIDSI